MIQKVVRKAKPGEFSEIRENLMYWRALPASERVSAVEVLRRQHHGDAARLQRVARVVERPLR